MGRLKVYKAKRKLQNTPEPSGGGSPDTKLPVFLIHKHAARHLHYDLRLEAQGTLKSWAVPKGPSLNPADKRLALMVEDHPLDYRTFEGTIPSGNYGAGTVMLWDEGTYSIEGAKTRRDTEKQFAAGLEKGHVEFTLHGKKLKGAFILTKIRGRTSDKGNTWLFFKKKDDYATEKEITKLDHSVKTNRSMEEIADPPQEPLKAPRKPLPKKIKPMLATLIKEPFNHKEWIFEIKWDGYRAIGQLEKGKVLLYSRNQKSFNLDFPIIVRALENIKAKSVVLDGEIVILNKSGKPDFQLMQNYRRTKCGTLIYFVFDLLYLNGQDLRSRPLLERKKALKELLSDEISPIRYCDHIEEKGKPFFKAAKKNQLEGIIGKKIDSTYQMRRSRDWVKIKSHLRQEVVIGGFTQPRGSRKKFGSLLLGVYEKGSLVYVGHVGGGFDEESLYDLYSKMEPLIQSKCPFKSTPKTNTPATWISPKLICEVAFAEWTSDGRMRQPIFKGLRIDKKPKQVKKEK